MLFEFCNGQELRKKISVGHWSVLGPGEEETWYGTHNYKPERKWNTTADVMVDKFTDSGHPVFRATSALNRGYLRKKGGRCTIHFSAEHSNAQLLFPATHSANQLSIHGAVANWCHELTQLIPGQSYLRMEFEDRIIFVSVFNDIGWSESEENSKECFSNSLKVRDHAKRFQKGHCSFLSPGDEEKMVWNERLQT